MNLRTDLGAFLMQPAPRFPEYRRVFCACGCGVWFYALRAPGRPPAYATVEHRLRHKYARRRAERRRA